MQYLFRHLNPFLPEKMQSDRKFRRHVIDPYLWVLIMPNV